MRVEYVCVSAPLAGGAFSEDAYLVDAGAGDKPFFAVVVDGHGLEVNETGDRLEKSRDIAAFAKMAAQCLRDGFRANPLDTTFVDLFASVETDLGTHFRPLTEGGRSLVSVGAVASFVVVQEDELVVAQVGDCRVYRALAPNGFRMLSRDHNGQRPSEVRRLEPFVRSRQFKLADLETPAGFSPVRIRLYQTGGRGFRGGLRPTRGFGNWEYRPAYTCEPEVCRFKLQGVHDGTFFALCTDGANEYVERTMMRFRENSLSVSLADVAGDTRNRLVRNNDDVTVVYFRITR
jgi:serine/threonine protein phosphatase PrpC